MIGKLKSGLSQNSNCYNSNNWNSYNWNSYNWRRMKEKDKEIFPAEEMLRDLEDNYTSACARFISREPSRDQVWTLNGKKGELLALIVNSKSTMIPVFYNILSASSDDLSSDDIRIPIPKFIGTNSVLKKIHSIQGLKEEVIILENVMKQFGRNIVDIYDYDLMSLDISSTQKLKQKHKDIPGLVLRVPGMIDLDKLAPLQTAYEQEEVLHRGSIFSPAASRINLANIVVGRKILVAEFNGRLVGKINVSAVSFTRFMVGGVYVHPDFRGRGIARCMASVFVKSLVNGDFGLLKGLTLFVKKSNLAARKLYSGIGFTVRSDYRITYY